MLLDGGEGVGVTRRIHLFLRRLGIHTPNLPLDLSSPHRI
jgi:hypothetical protein